MSFGENLAALHELGESIDILPPDVRDSLNAASQSLAALPAEYDTQIRQILALRGNISITDIDEAVGKLDTAKQYVEQASTAIAEAVSKLGDATAAAVDAQEDIRRYVARSQA